MKFSSANETYFISAPCSPIFLLHYRCFLLFQTKQEVFPNSLLLSNFSPLQAKNFHPLKICHTKQKQNMFLQKISSRIFEKLTVSLLSFSFRLPWFSFSTIWLHITVAAASTDRFSSVTKKVKKVALLYFSSVKIWAIFFQQHAWTSLENWKKISWVNWKIFFANLKMNFWTCRKFSKKTYQFLWLQECISGLTWIHSGTISDRPNNK